MKNKIKLFFLCFILIFSISFNSFPKNKKSYHTFKISKLLKCLDLYSPRMILKNKERLGLIPKQKELIETEILSHGKYIIKNGAEIKIIELELLFLLSQEPVNKKQITEKIRESGKLKTNSFIKHLKHLFNIKDILSEKQIKMLVKRYASELK